MPGQTAVNLTLAKNTGPVGRHPAGKCSRSCAEAVGGRGFPVAVVSASSRWQPQAAQPALDNLDNLAQHTWQGKGHDGRAERCAEAVVRRAADAAELEATAQHFSPHNVRHDPPVYAALNCIQITQDASMLFILV